MMTVETTSPSAPNISIRVCNALDIPVIVNAFQKAH